MPAAVVPAAVVPVLPVIPVVPVVAQGQRILDKQKPRGTGETWGGFHYKINWEILNPPNFKTLIIQKVTVTHQIKVKTTTTFPISRITQTTSASGKITYRTAKRGS